MGNEGALAAAGDGLLVAAWARAASARPRAGALQCGHAATLSIAPAGAPGSAHAVLYASGGKEDLRGESHRPLQKGPGASSGIDRVLRFDGECRRGHAGRNLGTHRVEHSDCLIPAYRAW